jgi:hypothetical protein
MRDLACKEEEDREGDLKAAGAEKEGEKGGILHFFSK